MSKLETELILTRSNIYAFLTEISSYANLFGDKDAGKVFDFLMDRARQHGTLMKRKEDCEGAFNGYERIWE